MRGKQRSLSAPVAVRPFIAEAQPGHFACSVWQNVSILIWADRATGPALQRIQSVTKSLIRRFPAGHSNVAFVLAGVGPPTPEAREAMTHLYRDGVAGLECLGVVLEGDGFWASTLRSSVTNMQLESGRKTALGQYGSIDDLVGWMAPLHSQRTGIAVTPLELRAALRAAREEGVPAAPR